MVAVTLIQQGVEDCAVDLHLDMRFQLVRQRVQPVLAAFPGEYHPVTRFDLFSMGEQRLPHHPMRGPPNAVVRAANACAQHTVDYCAHRLFLTVLDPLFAFFMRL
nr:hypothetical protein [Caballeronia choica]